MQGQPHNEKVLKLTEQDVVPKQFDLLWKKILQMCSMFNTTSYLFLP